MKLGTVVNWKNSAGIHRGEVTASRGVAVWVNSQHMPEDCLYSSNCYSDEQFPIFLKLTAKCERLGRELQKACDAVNELDRGLEK